MSNKRNHADSVKLGKDSGMDDVKKFSEISGVLSGGAGKGGKLKELSPLMEHYAKTRSFSKYKDAMKVVKDLVGPRVNFSGRGAPFYEEIARFAGNNAGVPAGGQQGALVDIPLSDTSLRYTNEGLIAKQVLTDNSVPQQSGDIAVYGQEHTNAPDLGDVTVEGKSNVYQLNTRSTSYIPYRVNRYAMLDSLSQSDIRNYREPFEAENDLVMAITELLMLVCEIDLASKFSGAVIPAARSIDLDFQNLGTAKDAISARDKMQRAMIAANGMGYNTAIMDRLTYTALRSHPDIIGTYFKDMSGQVTASEQQVKDFLEVDRLLISDAWKTVTSKRDATKSRVWGSDIYMANISPSKGRRMTTLGFNHNYGELQNYVIRRPGYANPENEDFFVYSNWNFALTDLTCLGKFVAKNL